MGAVPELYVRAVGYAVSRGFNARDEVVTWHMGGYRWVINGKREPVEGIPFGHLAVFNAGEWPVVLLGPGGGNVIGELDVEDKLIAMLKAENPVEL